MLFLLFQILKYDKIVKQRILFFFQVITLINNILGIVDTTVPRWYCFVRVQLLNLFCNQFINNKDMSFLTSETVQI